MAVKYGSLPFQEAIDYLQGKVNVPTQTWTDVWEGQHARAFTVAGATKDELLTDLRGAVEAAVKDGETLRDFRKRFDAIAERHGWAYNGGRNWRTRVIYETNMRTAYQAGRYQQLQAVKARRPFWEYKHSDFVKNPRPEHEAWDGLVLSADDPFWETHFPPNGWGCRCSIRALSKRDLTRRGLTGPDDAPPLELEEHTVGIRGPNPKTVKVPKGIDPGWGYNPGQAATGKTLSREAMDGWAKTEKQWTPLIQKTHLDFGRPERLTRVKPPVKLGKKLTSQDDVVQALTRQLDGDSKVYNVSGLPVLVDAEVLGRHLELSRTPYLPLLDDALTKPAETWLNWERHQGTGKVRLVARALKAYDIGKGRNLLVVTVASEGYMLSHTMIPVSDNKYINRQRIGQLLDAGEGEE